MKKLGLTLLSIGLFTTIGFSQQSKGMINTNDQKCEIDILPENPEKVGKFVRDTKIKTVLKEKNAILTNHTVTFYTTAFYKYKENSSAAMGGKVGQRVGFELSGVSDETFQEITDETGKYLAKKLKENGYTMDEYSKFTSAKKHAKLKEKANKGGEEHETQNLYLTKKVKAKRFAADKQLIYPPIVGTTSYYGAVKESGATYVMSDFKINFISIGHTVTNTSTVSEYKTSYGIDVQEAIYGSASLSFLTPKLKYGYFDNKWHYRAENLMSYTTTGEKNEDGFHILKVDEAKYKQASISLVNGYIDLMMRNMKEIEAK